MSDETKCDSCGQPTPRLDPPDAVELCDDCHNAEQRLDIRRHLAQMRQRELNEAVYMAAIRKMWAS